MGELESGFLGGLMVLFVPDAKSCDLCVDVRLFAKTIWMPVAVRVALSAFWILFPFLNVGTIVARLRLLWILDRWRTWIPLRWFERRTSGCVSWTVCSLVWTCSELVEVQRGSCWHGMDESPWVRWRGPSFWKTCRRETSCVVETWVMKVRRGVWTCIKVSPTSLRELVASLTVSFSGSGNIILSSVGIYRILSLQLQPFLFHVLQLLFHFRWN